MDHVTHELQELLEQRRQRRAQRQELGKRRSVASQNRMRIISQLAEEGVGKRSKRSREDTFGMNDDDWNVYRAIVSNTSSPYDEMVEGRGREVLETWFGC